MPRRHGEVGISAYRREVCVARLHGWAVVGLRQRDEQKIRLSRFSVLIPYLRPTSEPGGNRFFMEDNIPTDVKVMGVVITNTKADGMLTYDAVRRAWQLTEEQLTKANEAKYVLAIESGTVVDIFEKHRGFRPSEGENDRYSFSPVPLADAAVRKRYVGKHWRSYGSPILFEGFDGE